MKPPRADIAAPELPSSLVWLGTQERRMAELTALGPALVHFFDFAQLNSVRTLPYLSRWQQRYGGSGLEVLGVQTPRFPFGAEPELVSQALSRLEVTFPVALDAERELWLDYGCERWPSLFIWGRGGALRWYHFGEGDYQANEEAIAEALAEVDPLLERPPPFEPLRPSDAPRARVVPPSPELFPAGDGQPWRKGAREHELEIAYEAGGAYATLEGDGNLEIELDGAELEPIAARGAFLYELASHPRHEAHRLVLRPSQGLSIWSVSFAAGLP